MEGGVIIEPGSMTHFRTLGGPARWLQKFLGLTVPLSGLAFVLDVPYHLFGISPFPPVNPLNLGQHSLF